eukprot:1141499-Pelagomonas_calceolata.AAC.2
MPFLGGAVHLLEDAMLPNWQHAGCLHKLVSLLESHPEDLNHRKEREGRDCIRLLSKWSNRKNYANQHRLHASMGGPSTNKVWWRGCAVPKS